MAKARRGARGPLKVAQWALRAPMFCLGLAAVVVLTVVFALVVATALAATVVPEGHRERKRGRRAATSRKTSGWKRVWAS